MSRGRKPVIEAQDLDTGLSQVEDPYGIKDLLKLAVDDLTAQTEREMRYAIVSLVHVGRHLKALKMKVGHGNWEAFVNARRWSWNHVHGSMRFLDVVVKFPKVLHLPPGRVTSELIRLPMAQIESVMQQLPPEAVKTLTLGEMDRLVKTLPKTTAGNNDRSAKEAQWATEACPIPTELDGLVYEAESALNKIAELHLAKPEHEQAMKHWEKLVRCWRNAARNLTDPERKRPDYVPPSDEFTPEEDQR